MPMRYILSLIVAVILIAPSLEASAGLVEDLRSGKSKVRASTTQGNWVGILRHWRQMKSAPDFKAIASVQNYSYAAWSHNSAEAAVEEALRYCKEQGGGRTRCKVYSVGNNIVETYTQKELADAIEAYQLEVSGSTATSSRRSEYVKCKHSNGDVFTSWGSCGVGKQITKAEYDRLKNKKTVTASKSKSFSGYCKTKYDYAYGTTKSECGGLDKEITLNEYNRLMKNNTGKSNKTTYCKRKNGVVYENSWSGMCGLNKQITKAEYDRLKDKKKG
ncbi:MAG: hypothetical protein CMM54_12155, partial [Rhodospirillaceae bacterium]|nr:hypothetical protein [Rhodospirillaceae bacterium]